MILIFCLVFRDIHHPGLCAVVSGSFIPTFMCIIYDGPLANTLDVFIHDSDYTELDFKSKVQVAIDLLKALDFLHERGMYHMNLKSNNIVIGDPLKIQLYDYGLYATVLADVMPDALTVFEPLWIAPESLLWFP